MTQKKGKKKKVKKRPIIDYHDKRARIIALKVQNNKKKMCYNSSMIMV